MISETSHPLVQKTAHYVKEKMMGEESGHDWWHVQRVWLLAQKLAIEEGADRLVVELAALLHDIADWKFHDGDETVGPATARAWLQSLQAPADVTDHVCRIIATLSFKGAHVVTPMETLEGAVVQDADRLDAIGAIGIARTFAYGGYVGQAIYHPDIPPVLHQSAAEYKQKRSTSLNHFYEKLFLLKDRMNTPSARRIAEERHRYMVKYVQRLADECYLDFPLPEEDGTPASEE
ncbi:HD domain-containing protein [Desmospora activa]|uniref:HD domain-containing protein n=1 Tax=Desmospora activa DSM 45169 TaxID=1121389 RepID=A0A2T4ZD01_9BACL|nr:HD domain-containing protein [Desmospora activa]PTM59760.1 uncharacterized protein C8J48_2391 [Desmospora activa DSM 45169]